MSEESTYQQPYYPPYGEPPAGQPEPVATYQRPADAVVAPKQRRKVSSALVGVVGLALGAVLGVGGTLIIHPGSTTARSSQFGGPGGGAAGGNGGLGGAMPSGAPSGAPSAAPSAS
jgi:hypothetical protein